MNATFHIINVLFAPLFIMLFVTVIIRLLRKQAYALPGKIKVLLLIPGTIIHELSHAVFATFSGMKIVQINLWSGALSGELGHVHFLYRKDKPIHYLALPFVALAPLFCIFLLWLGVYRYNDLPIVAIPPINLFDIHHWESVSLSIFQDIVESLSNGVTLFFTIPVALLLPWLWPSLSDFRLAAKGVIPWALILLLTAIVIDTLQAWPWALAFLYDLQSIVISVCLNLIIMCVMAFPVLFLINVSDKALSRSCATR